MSDTLGEEARKSKLDFNTLKSGGFIKQTQENLFTVRLRCPGGKITSQQLHKAAEIAEKYGKGEVHTSMRQSIEVPYVHYRDFDAIAASLKEINWSVASCGPRIRVPTACAGCTYNPNGIMDTQKVCAEVDKRFFGTETAHHKFKISFSGCPIDCPRTREADLGFQGIVEPGLNASLCNACGLCVANCEEKALKLVNDLPERDKDKCNYCGDCIKVCPMDAMTAARKGWLVRAGGKHGKHPIFSWEVAQFISDEQIPSVIENAMAWYKANSKGRERVGAAMIRRGVDKFVEEAIKPLGVETVDSSAARKKLWATGNMYQ
jgi:dissimilatory sulfite reductase (desulfoviridin) alpha/beta subunit